MSDELEKELKRTTEMRGFRFGLHDFVAQLKGVEALKKHNDHTAVNYLKKGLLDRKTKEFAIITACIAARDDVSHMQCHMWAAQRAGITPEEILELIDLVCSHLGSIAKSRAIEAWRLTFRPDIPTIYRMSDKI